MNKVDMNKLTIMLMLSFITGCVRTPENINPVENFVLDRYLGKWYEIARLDHSFERGLSMVTAEYSMREDGAVRVINRGYSETKGSWQEAEGKAYFVTEASRGFLKVSFFGPFYGSYIIIDLDHDTYQYSLVSGPDTSYLWILARTPTLDSAIIDKLVGKAAALGFDTDALIYVKQLP